MMIDHPGCFCRFEIEFISYESTWLMPDWVFAILKRMPLIVRWMECSHRKPKISIKINVVVDVAIRTEKSCALFGMLSAAVRCHLLPFLSVAHCALFPTMRVNKYEIDDRTPLLNFRVYLFIYFCLSFCVIFKDIVTAMWSTLIRAGTFLLNLNCYFGLCRMTFNENNGI